MPQPRHHRMSRPNVIVTLTCPWCHEKFKMREARIRTRLIAQQTYRPGRPLVPICCSGSCSKFLRNSADPTILPPVSTDQKDWDKYLISQGLGLSKGTHNWLLFGHEEKDRW